MISVIAGDYGQTAATFTAYERVDGVWRVAFGPWDARVGTERLRAPGRET